MDDQWRYFAMILIVIVVIEVIDIKKMNGAYKMIQESWQAETVSG